MVRRLVITASFLCLMALVPAQAFAAVDWWSTQGVTKLDGIPTPPAAANLDLNPKNIGLNNIILRIYTIPTAALLATPDRHGELVNKIAFYIRAMQHFGMGLLSLTFIGAFIKLYSFQIMDNKLSPAIASFVKYMMHSVMIYLAPLLVLTAITIMYYLYQFTVEAFGIVDPTSQVYTCVTLYFDIIKSYIVGSPLSTPNDNTAPSIADVIAKSLGNISPIAVGVSTFLTPIIMILSSSPYLLFITIVTIAIMMITVSLILFALGILFSSLYSMMITLMFLPIFFGLDMLGYSKPLEMATGNIITPLFIPILLYIMILFPVKILGVVLDPYVISLTNIHKEIDSMHPNLLSVGPLALKMGVTAYSEIITILIPVLVSLSFLFVIISMLKSVPEIAQNTIGGSIAKLSTAGAGVVAGLVGTGVGLAAGGLFRGGGAALGAAADSKAGQAVMGRFGKSGGSTGSPGQTAGQTEPTFSQGTGNNSGFVNATYTGNGTQSNTGTYTGTSAGGSTPSNTGTSAGGGTPSNTGTSAGGSAQSNTGTSAGGGTQPNTGTSAGGSTPSNTGTSAGGSAQSNTGTSAGGDAQSNTSTSTGGGAQSNTGTSASGSTPSNTGTTKLIFLPNKKLTTGQKISQGADKIGDIVQNTSHGTGQAVQNVLEEKHDQVANIVNKKYDKLKKAKKEKE